MKRKAGVLYSLIAVAIVATSAPAQDASQLETLKAQADEAYQNRDFPATIEFANQVLGTAPSDHVALYLRGSARVELGVGTGNVNLIRQGIADAREAVRHEGQGKAEYYLPYLYGMSQLTAYEQKPVHAQTAKSFVDSLLEREDLSSEQRANLLYQRAQASIRLKELSEADASIRRALESDPKHLAGLMLLAEITAQTKTSTDAIAAYTRVVQTFPENPVTYNNRGMYLQSQGRVQEALQDFAKAIQVDAKFIPAYINRGFAYLEAGDPVTAEAALNQALQVDPAQPGAIRLRAMARLNQVKTAEALADYRQIVEMAPQNPMSHADLGFAQFFSNDFSGALTSFQEALQLDSNARFLIPWRLASEIRTGQYQQSSYQSTISKPVEQRDWVDSLIMFQIGQADARALLGAVHPSDEKAREAQLCEGYYFIAMELVRREREQDAVGYLQQAVKSKLPQLSAYRGAMFALKNSGQSVR